MLDHDLNAASGSDSAIRVSNNVALFLSKKVTAAQREVTERLRTEVLDHTRPETARKEPDKGREAEKADDKGEGNADSVGETSQDASPEIRQLNITV